MPRPKRAKVVPSGPRVRRGSKVSSTVRLQAEIEKEGPNNADDISDPDEGLVISARRVKRNNGKGRSLEIGIASAVADSVVDALGSEDVPAPVLSRLATEIPSAESLSGDLHLESSSPCVGAGRRDGSINGVENSLLAIGNFKRRPRQNSILGCAAIRARSSSVESNLAENNGLVSVGKGSRSTFENANYQRHGEEPSVMGYKARRARSSSIELNMDRATPAFRSALKTRCIKRRAREPSILGTAKKQPQRVPYDDEEDDDEDDFTPDDESTPLNQSKIRTTNSSSAPSSSTSRKRKLSALQTPQFQPQRTVPSLPVDDSIEETSVIPASIRQTTDKSDEEEHVPEEELAISSPAQEIRIPSIEANSAAELFSETMAPPQSSSPSIPSSPAPPTAERLQTRRAPSRGRRPLRSQTPFVFNQDSPPSSPPSLTHSPNRPARATTKNKKINQPPPTSTLSTAQLQALLPRRRRRAIDDFDISNSEDGVDVSGLASDDDELTHSNIRAPPRRNAPAPAARLKPQSVAKAKASAKITYVAKRLATSDKENEEEIDPDDSLAPVRDDEVNADPEISKKLEKRIGKELKRAAKKFAEVDKWEMEFEDVTASSSSPKDAR